LGVGAPARGKMLRRDSGPLAREKESRSPTPTRADDHWYSYTTRVRILVVRILFVRFFSFRTGIASPTGTRRIIGVLPLGIYRVVRSTREP